MESNLHEQLYDIVQREEKRKTTENGPKGVLLTIYTCYP